MKPAIISLLISTALVFAGWMVYSKSTEKAAANMGIQAPTK